MSRLVRGGVIVALVGLLAGGVCADLEGLRRTAEQSGGWERLRARVALAEELEAELLGIESLGAVRTSLLEELARLFDQLGCPQEAHRAYEELLASGPGLESGPDLLFRAAGAARRSGARARAAELYRGFLEREPALADPPSRRLQARAWLARLLSELGHGDEARRRWRAIAHDATDPLHGIDAFDRLALDALEAGDREAAAGWLHAARTRFVEAGSQLTPDGERVRRALVRMRANDELSLASRRVELDPNALDESLD